MPPRKRARLHSRQESSASLDAPAASTPAGGDKPELPSGTSTPMRGEGLEPDPWTDEQEIALLKGMIRWKPVGMSLATATKFPAAGLHSLRHQALGPRDADSRHEQACTSTSASSRWPNTCAATGTVRSTRASRACGRSSAPSTTSPPSTNAYASLITHPPPLSITGVALSRGRRTGRRARGRRGRRGWRRRQLLALPPARRRLRRADVRAPARRAALDVAGRAERGRRGARGDERGGHGRYAIHSPIDRRDMVLIVGTDRAALFPRLVAPSARRSARARSRRRPRPGAAREGGGATWACAGHAAGERQRGAGGAGGGGGGGGRRG